MFPNDIFTAVKDFFRQKTSCLGNDCILASKKKNARAVSQCNDLITNIISHLSDPKDRRNFQLACKRFDILLHKKSLNIFQSPCNEENIYIYRFFYHHERIVVRKNEIDIRYRSIMYENEDVKNKIENILKYHINGKDTLSVRFLRDPDDNITFNLDIYQNIKIFRFHCSRYFDARLFPFSQTSKISPHTLIFNNKSDEEDWAIRESYGIWYIPDTVTTIYFLYNSHELLELEKGLKISQNHIIDNLFIQEKNIHYLSLLMDNDAFLSTIKYFKTINIIIDDFLDYRTSDVIEIINHTSKKIDNVNFFLKLQITNDVNTSLETPHNAFRNLLFAGVFDNIKSLKIHCRYLEDSLMGEAEFETLKRILPCMVKLTTLNIDFATINNYYIFNEIIRMISSNVKNLRIINCSKMKLKHLKTLVKYCKYIEVLSLYEVNSNEITLSKILNNFPTLKILDIRFTLSYKVMNILDDLKHEKDGVTRLKWPETSLLMITSNIPNSEEKEILSQIDYGTPRKGDQFVIKNKLFFNHQEYLSITIQKQINQYGRFKQLDKISFLADKNDHLYYLNTEELNNVILEV